MVQCPRCGKLETVAASVRHYKCGRCGVDVLIPNLPPPGSPGAPQAISQEAFRDLMTKMQQKANEAMDFKVEQLVAAIRQTAEGAPEEFREALDACAVAAEALDVAYAKLPLEYQQKVFKNLFEQMIGGAKPPEAVSLL
jgi:hypothetical protein